MSDDPRKVLAKQIESLKQYQTGMRELIGVLSDLAARRATIANVSGYIRNLSYGLLATAGLAAAGGALLGKALVGKVLALLGASTRLGAWAAEAKVGAKTFLEDRDYAQVERMIDQAHEEFLKAERKIRQLRREYNELGCPVKYGTAP